MPLFKAKETINAGTEFLGAANSIVESTVTNQKQRAALKNQFSQLFIGLDKFINEQVTARAKSDNEHGSLLTKNIRPVTLLVLVLSFVFSDYLGLAPEKTMVLAEWGKAAIGFYFGFRTLEKSIPLISNFTKSIRRRG